MIDFSCVCFVQVERHGSRRELRLLAVKTVSYINLFTVSVCGSVGGLETRTCRVDQLYLSN